MYDISYHDIPYDDHELQWEDGEGTTTAGNEGSGPGSRVEGRALPPRLVGW